MAQSIREVMSTNPVTLQASATVSEAAQQMKQREIGDVLVMDGDRLCGVVTDRDVVVRVVAEGQDPNSCKLGDVCSRDPVCLTPDDTAEEAVKLMSDKAIRRVPVVENGKPVGIVSLGDLAIERDSDSVLADISGAPANNN